MNAGNDRSDAREMRCFSDGWRRIAVPLSTGRHALGLSNDSGAVVVELDDFGVPIVVTARGLAAVEELERGWPHVDDALVDGLGTESLPLRYWVLERLDAEGSPPHRAYGVLPWSLLDRAVDAVMEALVLGESPRELVEIRHWLTPAVRGLTGPLEQLDHGLRIADPTIARMGASALLTNLCDIPVSRVPEGSRRRLRHLVDLLGISDPLYRHVSRVAAARLVGTDEVSMIRTVLTPSMEPAAGRHDVRQHTEKLGDDDQWVRVTKTQAGHARLTAHVAQGATAHDVFTHRTGAFLPILITPRSGGEELRYWIALYAEEAELVGSIDVVIPKGQSRLVADAAPVGIDELAHVDPQALLNSLRVSSSLSQMGWFAAAEAVPGDHPLSIALREWHGTP